MLTGNETVLSTETFSTHTEEAATLRNAKLQRSSKDASVAQSCISPDGPPSEGSARIAMSNYEGADDRGASSGHMNPEDTYETAKPMAIMSVDGRSKRASYHDSPTASSMASNNTITLADARARVNSSLHSAESAFDPDLTPTIERISFGFPSSSTFNKLIIPERSPEVARTGYAVDRLGDEDDMEESGEMGNSEDPDSRPEVHSASPPISSVSPVIVTGIHPMRRDSAFSALTDEGQESDASPRSARFLSDLWDSQARYYSTASSSSRPANDRRHKRGAASLSLPLSPASFGREGTQNNSAGPSRRSHDMLTRRSADINSIIGNKSRGRPEDSLRPSAGAGSTQEGGFFGLFTGWLARGHAKINTVSEESHEHKGSWASKERVRPRSTSNRASYGAAEANGHSSGWLDEVPHTSSNGAYSTFSHSQPPFSVAASSADARSLVSERSSLHRGTRRRRAHERSMLRRGNLGRRGRGGTRTRVSGMADDSIYPDSWGYKKRKDWNYGIVGNESAFETESERGTVDESDADLESTAGTLASARLRRDFHSDYDTEHSLHGDDGDGDEEDERSSIPDDTESYRSGDFSPRDDESATGHETEDEEEAFHNHANRWWTPGHSSSQIFASLDTSYLASASSVILPPALPHFNPPSSLSASCPTSPASAELLNSLPPLPSAPVSGAGKDRQSEDTGPGDDRFSSNPSAIQNGSTPRFTQSTRPPLSPLRRRTSLEDSYQGEPDAFPNLRQHRSLTFPPPSSPTESSEDVAGERTPTRAIRQRFSTSGEHLRSQESASSMAWRATWPRITVTDPLRVRAVASSGSGPVSLQTTTLRPTNSTSPFPVPRFQSFSLTSTPPSHRPYTTYKVTLHTYPVPTVVRKRYTDFRALYNEARRWHEGAKAASLTSNISDEARPVPPRRAVSLTSMQPAKHRATALNTRARVQPEVAELLPPFPPKTFFQRFSASVIKERAAAFEKILTHPDFVPPHLLRDFMGLSS
ncbi:uncharacterized protein EV422DRAFT_535969 [Fimicolochytrium jonesii]|uniref:uncharacterized protein n=1 Tax=Fimicolochytrium jonesii TaxID=1396493 RepID=UPI0022FDB66D|nr:uncharacterized protein EV422DRAFT_535969 [Fimicolochytrium jonesii]KAI8818943.1 hypothetical protein EV422DRAFT_535969 [Fimicolochytrium jonesii]